MSRLDERIRLRQMEHERQENAYLASEREQLQRISAVARTAANIASRASLESMLSVMAREIQQTDGIVGTQIILVTSAERKLRMMGSAGFAQHPDFFDTLIACRELGAPLATYEALETSRQQVYAARKTEMLNDSRWAPMRDYISEIDWRDFVATPFGSPEGVRGVINCYLSPRIEMSPALGRFLEAMAEQAALAVDYHELMERDRTRVRQDERERIARDLHDAVIQNMFAININASVLESLAKTTPGATNAVGRARDIQQLATTVQRDLRGIIRALRPSIVADRGFVEALESFAAATATRFDVRVELKVVLDHQLDPAMADDCYYVLVEAVHNAVKHAEPTVVAVVVTSHPSGSVTASITDDGSGIQPHQVERGYGVASMRHRVAQWSGSFTLAPSEPHGTTVEAIFMTPIPSGVRGAR